jgi:polysaccharide export outer membrane protein
MYKLAATPVSRNTIPGASSYMTGKIFKLLLIILILHLAACTPGVDIREDEEVSVARRSFSFEGDQSFDMLSRYRISAGDVLDVLYQIRTWIEKPNFQIATDHTVAVKFVYTPELNTEQLVRPNGMITLPYLGEIYVVGKTPKQLEEELKKAYSSILRDPEIYVQVPQFLSAIQELKKDLHTAPRGLSRLVSVHPDGFVTFPMLGEVMVAGRTIQDVNSELNQRYEAIIPGLHVDLFLEKHTGTQVYVLGAVEKPGGFIIGKPISVAQALALAGSFDKDAELSSVIVARRHQNKIAATRLDLTKSADLGGRGSLFFLMPDDIVYVPRTRLSEAAQIGTELRDTLMFRGWSINLDDISVEDVF